MRSSSKFFLGVATLVVPSAVAACSGSQEPLAEAGGGPSVHAADGAVATPKFPAALSAVDGHWLRIGGTTWVHAALDYENIVRALKDREPLAQSFVVKDGKGVAVNGLPDLDGGTESCVGDREITFTLGEGGAWFVVEGAPRVAEARGKSERECQGLVGYAMFSHEPLALERVELMGEDRLLVTYGAKTEVHRGRVAAQLFERIEER